MREGGWEARLTVVDDIGQKDKENTPARRAWAERVSDGLGENRRGVAEQSAYRVSS